VRSNVSTIVDLLEGRGVSWGAYLESLPYSDYTADVADDLYYRKHNPLVPPISMASSLTLLRSVFRVLLQMIPGYLILRI